MKTFRCPICKGTDIAVQCWINPSIEPDSRFTLSEFIEEIVATAVSEDGPGGICHDCDMAIDVEYSEED